MARVKNGTIRTIAHHSLAFGTGYLVWLMLYLHLPITQQYTADVSFFNLPDTISVDAPETISVTLHAPRAVLDTITPTVHINADEIPLELATTYQIDQKNLLVPYAVDMVHCYPPVMRVTKKRLDTI